MIQFTLDIGSAVAIVGAFLLQLAYMVWWARGITGAITEKANADTGRDLILKELDKAINDHIQECMRWRLAQQQEEISLLRASMRNQL